MRRVWTHVGAIGSRGIGVSRDTRSPRHSMIIGTRLALGVIALCAIAILPARQSQAATPKTSPKTQTVQTAQMTMPIVQRVTLAESSLANACIRAGKPKSECVCVTRTLRKAIDPYDYAASVLLQTASYSPDTGAVAAAKLTLARSGVSQSEIAALETQRRRIVKTRLDRVCTLSTSAIERKSGS